MKTRKSNKINLTDFKQFVKELEKQQTNGGLLIICPKTTVNGKDGVSLAVSVNGLSPMEVTTILAGAAKHIFDGFKGAEGQCKKHTDHEPVKLPKNFGKLKSETKKKPQRARKVV